MKKLLFFSVISVVIAVSAYLFLHSFLLKSSDGHQNKIIIAVSVLPQTYFVKSIGKDKISVFEIVPPEAEPATYEPLPMQISKLSNSDIYFTIGVPFENSFITKIRNELKKTVFVKTDANTEKIEMEHHHHSNDENVGEEETHHHGEKDPHIWLDPQLVKEQAEIIYKTLSLKDSPNKEFYKHNLDLFLKEIDDLDKYIAEKLFDVKGTSFIVFHPVWGYFAKRYGLRQIAIEVDGKEPSPADIKQIIEKAKKENVRAIFLQEQFSRKSGEKVGEAVGLEPVFLNPLSGDYINNMKHIADIMSIELKKEKSIAE